MGEAIHYPNSVSLAIDDEALKKVAFSSPPACGRPTLDETGPAALSSIPCLTRRHGGRFFHGAEEPVI